MDFGGEMNFAFSGNPLTMRGEFKLEPSNVSTDGITNQNNTTSRSFKPTGYMAETKFEDNDVGTPTALNWEGIIRGGPYNITVKETQTNTMHTWTGAKFVGAVSVDRNNGEVTGLKIHADTYKATSL